MKQIIKTMNPKEKAKELIEKFDVIHYTELSKGRKLPVSMHNDQIKQCAIIAVDEIIYLLNYFNEEMSSTEQYEYWQEVKTEIEKL